MLVLFCHSQWYPLEDGEHPAITMLVLYWMMDALLILGRFRLFSPNPGWVDHFSLNSRRFFFSARLPSAQF
jgi:hypothetical protein